jgi:hypothetical protein
MYYDDFLLDYKLYEPDFNSKDHDDPEKYFSRTIGNYFNERVQIYINRKLINGTLSELSINSYEILMSLSYPSDKPPKILRIRNQVLTKIYSDQTNMVYLNIVGYENAVKLTSDNPDATIKLE